MAMASARRARSASRCVRSRCRAMAWRCAWALESFEAREAIAAAAHQRTRAMAEPFAVDGQSLGGVTDLRMQHSQCQFRAAGREAPEMRMGVGLQSAGQG